MKKIILRIIITVLLVILALITVITLHIFRIISIGQRTFSIETDYNDKIIVKVQPNDLGTVITPGCARIVFEVRGKEGLNDFYHFWLPEDFDKDDINVEFLLAENDIRYYRLNFNFDAAAYMYIEEIIPDFLLVDEKNDIWEMGTLYPRVVDNYESQYYPFARYYFLQGEQDWVVCYGDNLAEEGDSEVLEMISSIADGTVELNGKKFSNEEIYNKCVELKNALTNGV